MATIFVVATLKVLVWPDQGMPQHVDAIVMMDGIGDRLNKTLELAYAHRAPVVVISRGNNYWGHGSVCAPSIPRVKIICFKPTPMTTQGEAEFAGKLARLHQWHSIALVSIAPQNDRARIRMSRCFKGSIYVVDASFPAHYWPYEIAYEWAATLKALILQRAC